MKKPYTQPSLIAYGNVEQLTKGNGSNNNEDTIFFTAINRGFTAAGSIDVTN